MLDLLIRLLACVAGQLPGKPGDENSCVLMPATQGLHHHWLQLYSMYTTFAFAVFVHMYTCACASLALKEVG